MADRPYLAVPRLPPAAEPRPPGLWLPLALGAALSGVATLTWRGITAERLAPNLVLGGALVACWLFALAVHLALANRARSRSLAAALERLEAEAAERERAEEALSRGEERYRLLFERNPGGVYRSTVDGRLLDCNEAFAHIYGYPNREAILARSAHALFADPADRAVLIARLYEQGALLNIEVRFK
jgi:PAS domain-containing protein